MSQTTTIRDLQLEDLPRIQWYMVNQPSEIQSVLNLVLSILFELAQKDSCSASLIITRIHYNRYSITQTANNMKNIESIYNGR